MTRRERLLATLRGKPVDRPAVNFYKISSGRITPDETDKYNIYTDPTWRSLISLAEEESDLLLYGRPVFTPSTDNSREEFYTTETYEKDCSRFTRTTIRVGGRELTQVGRRDRNFHTTWALEHFCKSIADAEAFLELPDEVFAYDVSVDNLKNDEKRVGDRGIVMVELHDPLLHVGELFSMEDFLVFAITEPKLIHRLLDKFARHIYGWTETVAREFPSLWRIGGAEYASEPYLPPRLFDEYEVKYTRPMVDCINKHGGFPRIHCHGRLRNILPLILKMNPAGIDPVEAPNQRDIELRDVRREYGGDLVLFGNIEVRDLVHMEPSRFEKLVARVLEDGTNGRGRGFVLMPTAAPAGRNLGPYTLENYETMIRLARAFG